MDVSRTNPSFVPQSLDLTVGGCGQDTVTVSGMAPPVKILVEYFHVSACLPKTTQRFNLHRDWVV